MIRLGLRVRRFLLPALGHRGRNKPTPSSRSLPKRMLCRPDRCVRHSLVSFCFVLASAIVVFITSGGTATPVLATEAKPPDRTPDDRALNDPIPENAVLLDNYVISVSPSLGVEELSASAAFDVTTGSEAGLDSLCFFLHDELKVDNVYDKERKQVKFTQSKVYYTLNYSLEANKVCVKLPERLVRGDTLRLTVFYQGKLSQFFVRSAADFMKLGSDGLFLRGPGYSAWFPTTAAEPDDINTPASFDVEVEVPLDWKAICEGEPSASRSPGGSSERTRTFRWVTKEKIPLSSAVVLASNYDTLSARVGGQTVSFWYFPSPEDSIASVKLFGAARELLGFFVQNYGDYTGSVSSPRFTMVEMPIYGDFSSGTIMGISKGRVREAGSVQKRAELASLIGSKMVQKFTVPAVDSSAPGAAFLLKSVPSYAYVPPIEAAFGKQFILQGSESTMRHYLTGRKNAESGRAGSPPEKPLAQIRASEIPLYRDGFLLEDRGTLVLHMLRKLVGDTNFCLAIKGYMAAFAERPESEGGEGGEAATRDSSAVVSEARVNRPAPRQARLEDFMQIAEAAGGQRLDWFFTEWLYGDVLPDYRIADMKVTVSRDTTFVEVKVENIGTGLMPVPVTLFTDKGHRTSQVWLAAHESAQMRFISRSKPKRVEIDPEKWILQADIRNDGLDVPIPGTGKR